MNFGLTAEQELVVKTVRGFVEKELYPLEPEVERTGHVPGEVGRDIQRKVKALGFYAPNIPEKYGGGGLDNVTVALLERELGRTSWALHVWWGRPSNILCACSEEQKPRYLAPTVSGEKIDALAISEPDAGSDVRGMKCTARKVGSDWVINGTKHFISHADVADFVILFAATSEEPESPSAGEAPESPSPLWGGSGRGSSKRITCFLVDRGTPGFEVRPGYQSVSYRGYNNSILSFDDCRVPASQILGEEGQGFEMANTWLRSTRLSVAATSVGKARRAFDLALDHAARRRQFGSPIGKFQGVSFQLADMVTEIDAAEYLTLAAAWRLDQGLHADREIAQAKLYASEMVARVTDRAIQIFGGMGLMSELPLERMWRDARVDRIWDGTSEIQRHIIARDLLRPLGA
jgi:acyl-CoA dehydrogenase